MNLHEIAENSGFTFIGIRSMTGGKLVNVGDELANSFVWVDGETTDEQLNGVCAIDCGFDGFDELKKLSKAMALIKQYQGQLVLVGSSKAEEGNDVGEIVMADAVVIAVL